MREAILVIYEEDQHCPSKPESDLVSVPESVDDYWLIELYKARVDDEVIESDFRILSDSEYGDIAVGHGSIWLYLTFTTRVPAPQPTLQETHDDEP